MYQGFTAGLSCPLVHTWTTEGFYLCRGSCCGCRGDGPWDIGRSLDIEVLVLKSCGHAGHQGLQHPECVWHACGTWYVPQPQSKMQQSFKWSFLLQGWRGWSLFVYWKEIRMLIVVESGRGGVQLHLIKNQLVFGKYSRKFPARTPFL